MNPRRALTFLRLSKIAVYRVYSTVALTITAHTTTGALPRYFAPAHKGLDLEFQRAKVGSEVFAGLFNLGRDCLCRFAHGAFSLAFGCGSIGTTWTCLARLIPLRSVYAPPAPSTAATISAAAHGGRLAGDRALRIDPH
jgi:hypothetical protein